MRKRESFSVEQNAINIETANERIAQTRMHSSRMRTIRCSGRLPGRGCLPRGCLPKGGGVCQGECMPGGVHLPPCEQNHRQVPKDYLSATSFADGKNQFKTKIFFKPLFSCQFSCSYCRVRINVSQVPPITLAHALLEGVA